MRYRFGVPSLCLAAAVVFGCAAASLLAASDAGAQAVANPGILNNIVNAFARVQAFERSLVAAASALFAALAAIQVVFVVGRHVRAGSDLGDVLGAVLETAVVLGFFYFLLLNMGDITRAVVSSFATWANDATVAAGGSPNMSPTNVVGIGINIAKTIWESISVYSPVQSFLLTIGGFLVLGAFSFLCGLVVEVIIETHVVAAASIIFMAFGGSYWTRDIAVAMLRAAIAIGGKRFFLQLLVGLAEVMMRDLAAGVRAGQTLDMAGFAVLVAVPFVLAYVCKTLPARTQAILNGAYVQGGGLHHATAGAAQAAATAAIAMAGTGAAATAAYRLASQQMAAREAASGQGGGGGGGSSSGGGIGRAAQIAGLAASNFKGALAQDVGNRLAGMSSGRGHAGFRAARALSQAGKQ